MVIQTPSPTRSPLVVFAGGGSGGHLYPALAIADALCRAQPGVRVVFFGTDRSIDARILNPTRHEFVAQSLPTLGRAPWQWPGMYFGYRRSSLFCRQRFTTDRPVLVIGTGGLASVPAIREAVRAGIPTAILNPDAVPGRANRFLANAVDLVFVQWEETVGSLPRSVGVVVSGCAVREAFNRADRSAGLARFGLDPDRKTLLITGASQGARTLNRVVVANLEFLESLPEWQILHLTGDLDYADVAQAYSARSVPAKVLAYTEDMADALAASDLVLARSGASTLAEVTAVGRPSILMPYPYHRDKHQLANARCLVRASAARIVHDRIDPAINGRAVRAALEQLMTDHELRRMMASSARSLGRGQAADNIAGDLLELIRTRGVLPAPKSVEALC